MRELRKEPPAPTAYIDHEMGRSQSEMQEERVSQPARGEKIAAHRLTKRAVFIQCGAEARDVCRVSGKEIAFRIHSSPLS